MKAMILAAGRGKRMRHLTANCPKPLVKLWGRPLIEWQILSLKKAGFSELIVNTAYCGAQLNEFLGDGSKWNVNIQVSSEGLTFEEALNTRGGIVNALDLLREKDSEEPFVVVSGDIVTEFDYSKLSSKRQEILDGKSKGHLILVPSPDYHRGGDMTIENGLVSRTNRTYTYGNIGIFSPLLFENVEIADVPLFPWFYRFIDGGLITGEVFEGKWANVGTPEELSKFEEQVPFLSL